MDSKINEFYKMVDILSDVFIFIDDVGYLLQPYEEPISPNTNRFYNHISFRVDGLISFIDDIYDSLEKQYSADVNFGLVKKVNDLINSEEPTILFEKKHRFNPRLYMKLVNYKIDKRLKMSSVNLLIMDEDEINEYVDYVFSECFYRSIVIQVNTKNNLREDMISKFDYHLNNMLKTCHEFIKDGLLSNDVETEMNVIKKKFIKGFKPFGTV